MNGHPPSGGLAPDQESLFFGQPSNFQFLGGAGQGSSTASHDAIHGHHDILQLLSLSRSEPWTPLMATTTSRTSKQRHPGLVDFQNFGDYRNTVAASDCEDSGYQSMRHSVVDASIYGDPDRGTETQSLLPFAELQLHGQHHGSPDSISVDGGQPPKSTWHRSAANPDAGVMMCPTCQCPVKTKAELNKHTQRHEKPFHCDVLGCRRKEGFGTTNDLTRHKQSVHGMDGVKYRCYEGTCKNKTKDWPRADNFKQHLKRVHGIHLPADADLSPYEYNKQARTNDLAGLVSPEAQPDVPVHPQQLSPWLMDSAQEVASLPSQEIEFPQMAHSQMDHSQIDHHRVDHDQMDHGIDLSDHQDPAHEAAEEPEDDNQVEHTAEQPMAANHLHLDMDPILLDLGHQHNHLGENGTAAPSDIYRDTHLDRPDRLSPSDLLMPAARSQMLRSFEASRLDLGQFRNRETSKVENSQQDTPHDSHQQARALSQEPHSSLREKDNTRSASGETVEDAKIRRSEPESNHTTAGASASDVKELLRSKTLDETEASAFLESLIEKGMLDKLASKLGYRVAREEDESKEGPLSPTTQSGEDSKETSDAKDGVNKDNKDNKCGECGKIFKRACELKKHMKRHLKPYACTHVSDCDKRFGSKNDWKRHENSQHIQLEFWRCTERLKDKERVVCNKICHRRETFRHHLDKDHDIRDALAVEKRCTDCRNGRNFESRFWCGFCQKTIEFEKNGGLAWSERFDHIDAHFIGKGGPKRDIADWKSIESEPLETFQDILPETRHIRPTAEYPSDYGSGAENEEELRRRDHQPPRKRRAVDDATILASKRMRQEKGFRPIDYSSALWVCCGCQTWWSHAGTTRCMECNHDFCMADCEFVLPEKEEDER
ncbi:hypothetical protein OQA88_11280 [Cercophora sp. LCS_1]